MKVTMEMTGAGYFQYFQFQQWQPKKQVVTWKKGWGAWSFFREDGGEAFFHLGGSMGFEAMKRLISMETDAGGDTFYFSC